VTKVDIAPKGDQEGLTSYRRAAVTDDAPPRVIVRHAITTLAGIAAEWIAAGKPEDMKVGGQDVQAGLFYAFRFESDPDAAQARYNLFRGCAVAILEARWAAVETVAAAVLDHGPLKRPEMIRLTAACSPQHDDPRLPPCVSRLMAEAGTL
jgi:hypothetical protein